MNGDAPLRDLEVWQPEDDGLGGGIEDDLKSTHGWSAHDMFAKVGWLGWCYISET